MANKFSAVKTSINGKICYIFPEGKDYAEAVNEMLAFALKEKLGERISFIIGSEPFELETYADTQDQKTMSIENAPMETESAPDALNVHFDDTRLVYVPKEDDTLPSVIKAMAKLATYRGIDVTCEGHGDLVLYPGEKPRNAEARYLLETMAANPLFSDEPEVLEYLMKKESKKLRARNEYTRLMANLPDFEDTSAIITWIEKMGKFLTPELPGERVLEAFAMHGINPELAAEKCDTEDERSYGLCAIAQCLSMIKRVGKIYPAAYQFTEDWRAKFKNKQ